MSHRPCRCWDCRKGRGLRAVAPRLALASDQLATRRKLAHVVRLRLVRAEALLAHRELQMVRAGAVGDASYLRKRAGKLAAAQDAVRSIRRRLAELERAA